jgi:hypothetical protein
MPAAEDQTTQLLIGGEVVAGTGRRQRRMKTA